MIAGCTKQVLCHAGDKEFTLKEVARCLKPGGAMVFSDLMGADDADEEALRRVACCVTHTAE